jgi:8-oxo-dGTP pyrophosphatase MutT (NUDIX family)
MLVSRKLDDRWKLGDKIEFESAGKFLSVQNAHGTYFYAERKGIDSCSFILVDRMTGKFGLIRERKPPLDARESKDVFLTTAFGGSNDIVDRDQYEAMSDEERISHFAKIVVTEAREEAGYDVPMERIVFASKDFVSTQMNQYCYGYVVDVTGLDPGETDPDDLEALASVRWLSYDEVLFSNDWKSKVIAAKISTYETSIW